MISCAQNVPEGAKLMTIGPSMANIVQFYGHRKAYGLSVSPNPLHRNPSYEPIENPDRMVRDNQLQYIVWDSFSAARSPYFARTVRRYADRYNGRAVHTETVTVTTDAGRRVVASRALASRVQVALATHPETRKYRFTVDAEEGVVTLEGTAALDQAAEVSRDVAGVRAVKLQQVEIPPIPPFVA